MQIQFQLGKKKKTKLYLLDYNYASINKGANPKLLKHSTQKQKLCNIQILRIKDLEAA